VAAEFEERGPVRRIGVSLVVLAEGDVAVDQRRERRRHVRLQRIGHAVEAQAEFRVTERFLPEQFPDGARAGRRHERAGRVLPRLAAPTRTRMAIPVELDVFAAAHEDRARRDERNELVCVGRKIVHGKRPGVLDKVGSHPVILTGSREALDLLADQMAPELGTALARRTDEAGKHARLVDQSSQRGFAIPRMPFEGDLLGINERVLLEEIYQLARTPSPGAERAPVVDLASLTFVDETDDALPQLVVVAAVGLDAAGLRLP